MWSTHFARGLTAGSAAKSETRIPKLETNTNEGNSNVSNQFGPSCFRFVSDFEIRHSSFPPQAGLHVDRNAGRDRHRCAAGGAIGAGGRDCDLDGAGREHVARDLAARAGDRDLQEGEGGLSAEFWGD